ncbi:MULTISPECIES: molybdopterin-dependent oxidoreductase [unclassified Sphingomonas]|uniref:molybdopterin-dependent oxidoreductase n=1 Tax=unclassified Sphingomonas TaxID=196159 RepID=UPI00082ECFC7|nr:MULTISPECIES: molybdopterin-dependent oxidoreductase [unclassified Sphingomonas]
MSRILTRRTMLTGFATGAGALLAGCDALGNNPAFRDLLFEGEDAHFRIQRSLTARNALAKEFRPEQMSPVFRANGTRNPNTDAYNAHVAGNFADWRVRVDGLVNRPLALSMAQLRQMPSRTQITRHDCVEGWSAIGKWHGAKLGPILQAAGLKDSARYLVFHCADLYGASRRPYYESIDLVDGFHPQTILAWALNDHLLGVPNGAPVRLRVERQLGYKQAKYIERIEAVSSLSGIYRGKGGYWEDAAGYEWYGGI